MHDNLTTCYLHDHCNTSNWQTFLAWFSSSCFSVFHNSHYKSEHQTDKSIIKTSYICSKLSSKLDDAKLTSLRQFMKNNTTLRLYLEIYIKIETNQWKQYDLKAKIKKLIDSLLEERKVQVNPGQAVVIQDVKQQWLHRGKVDRAGVLRSKGWLLFWNCEDFSLEPVKSIE